MVSKKMMRRETSFNAMQVATIVDCTENDTTILILAANEGADRHDPNNSMQTVHITKECFYGVLAEFEERVPVVEHNTFLLPILDASSVPKTVVGQPLVGIVDDFVTQLGLMGEMGQARLATNGVQFDDQAAIKA